MLRFTKGRLAYFRATLLYHFNIYLAGGIWVLIWRLMGGFVGIWTRDLGRLCSCGGVAEPQN